MDIPEGNWVRGRERQALWEAAKAMVGVDAGAPGYDPLAEVSVRRTQKEQWQSWYKAQSPDVP